MGKVFGFIGGNIALLIWNAIGVYLVFLAICAYIHPTKETTVWLIISVLIFWGGINDIGYIWIDILGQGNYSMGNGFGWPDMYYGYAYQYTPNDALLAWVYNQTIVPWLATAIFMIMPKVEFYAYWGLCSLAYGPIPFIGLVIFMAADFIGQVIKNARQAFARVLSIENLTASISIFPIFYLFYKTNISGTHIGVYTVPDMFGLRYIVFFMVFYMLEFGIYAALIKKDYKHSLLFGVVVGSLILIPHFQLGFGRDFCMRASIPALFVLMLLVIRYLREHTEQTDMMTVLLIICLTISGIGTCKDWAVKVKAVMANDWKPVCADDIGSFSDKRIGDVDWLENFLVPDPEQTTFFKYLAK